MHLLKEGEKGEVGGRIRGGGPRGDISRGGGRLVCFRGKKRKVAVTERELVRDHSAARDESQMVCKKKEGEKAAGSGGSPPRIGQGRVFTQEKRNIGPAGGNVAAQKHGGGLSPPRIKNKSPLPFAERGRPSAEGDHSQVKRRFARSRPQLLTGTSSICRGGKEKEQLSNGHHVDRRKRHDVAANLRRRHFSNVGKETIRDTDGIRPQTALKQKRRCVCLFGVRNAADVTRK